ncbi:MAG: alpha/beta hydrolase [Anaerolineales bacterium]|nr:alpha/beta hydrolase [Anaerolineales bacterium]
MQANHVNINGVSVHYRVVGHGPDILFLHGWSSSNKMWDAVSSALAVTHQCWTLDWPGFGYSEKPGDFWYSIPNFTETLYHFAECMGLRQLDVVGHSMGGLIALDFSATHPERVRRLVAINPVVSGRAYLGPLAGWRRGGAILGRLHRLSREWLMPVLHNPLTASLPRSVQHVRRKHLEFNQATPQSLLGSGKAILDYDVRPKLKNITAKTAIILSTVDASVPNSEGHLAAVEIPGARLYVLPATHTVTDDRPVESLKLLRQILA